jgi:hypothetical protein
MATFSHNANDLTPTMTNYSTPSPAVVSASSEYNTSYQSWRAFDNLGSAVAGWAAGSGAIPAWLQIYSGGDGWAVSTYTVCVFYSTSSSAPKDWTLLGSNDETNWVLLDTQTSQTAWETQEMRTFSVVSPGSYTYYRINITSVNGGSFAGVGELELIGTIGLVASNTYIPFRGRDRFLNYI